MWCGQSMNKNKNKMGLSKKVEKEQSVDPEKGSGDTLRQESM